MAKIPLGLILEKKYGISKIKSREELDSLIEKIENEGVETTEEQD